MEKSALVKNVKEQEAMKDSLKEVPGQTPGEMRIKKIIEPNSW